MTATDRERVSAFFSEYVVWMRRDIGREIEWFRAGHDAGNMLCGLGLVVYTEVLGRVRRWNLDQSTFRQANGDERSHENFESFFDTLASGEYGRWRRAWEDEHFETSIYEVLRSGMVHEYRPKAPSLFYMGAHDRVRGVDYEAGRLGVYVIPYYRDFCVAADALRDELLALASPSLPDQRFARGVNAFYPGPYVGQAPDVGTAPTPSIGSFGVISPSSSASTPIIASGADLRNVPKELLRPRGEPDEDEE